MWSKLRAAFHVEIAQRLDQAFLARKNFLWSFSAHIRPNNATFAARFEQTKTPACETQIPKRKHARQPEDDNRNHPLVSPACFPPFRQEYRTENEPRNSQRRKNTERHAEAVRIDAQIAARSERHDPDEHRRKQRA